MKTNYWVACHMFWSADGLRVHIEEEMKIFVSDKKRRIEYTETLSTPLKRSYVVVEELALLQLIHLLPPHLRKLIEDEQYTDIIIAIMKEEYPAIYRKLVSHTKSFAFVPFGYIGPCCWSIDDILKRIKEMLKKGNYNDRRQKLESYRPALEEKQREIIENLALPLYLQRLFADLRRIAVMQDKRKMYCTRSHVFLNQYLLHHISKKTNIPLSLLRVMTVREIRDVLKGKHFSLKKLYQRRKKAILCITKDKFDVYTGKEADAVLKTLESNSKEVKGLVGSSGRAKGDVSLILSAQDIGKMKKGNILVAPSTTPDFLPAMAIAAAIVTNDGGITSHAAIVSRELGIPCIIGTKNATRMLHNDDFVEVDAEKGIVKIIK